MKRAGELSRGALGRLVSEQEAADAILFLASAASGGMTGQIKVSTEPATSGQPRAISPGARLAIVVIGAAVFPEPAPA